MAGLLLVILVMWGSVLQLALYRATITRGYKVPSRYKMVQDFTTNFLQLGDHLRQVRKHRHLVLAIATPVILLLLKLWAMIENQISPDHVFYKIFMKIQRV